MRLISWPISTRHLMPRLAKPDSDFGRPSVSRLASSRGPSGPADLHRVRRRQSDAHGPSLLAGLGPGRCNTDFVSVISAIVSPVGRGSLAAVPFTINA